MPIEIRELHIKVKITGDADRAPEPVKAKDIEALRSDFIKECTERVIEKLKEREEK